MKLSLFRLVSWTACLTILTSVSQAQQINGNPQQGVPAQQQAQSQSPSYEQQLQQQQQNVVQPRQPAGFPLRAEDQQYIDQLLSYWEQNSDKINRYKCNFTRWQFDPVTCNYRIPGNNQLAAAMISKGNVRYSKPDKGMYEVLEMWQFAGPPKEAGGQPEYVRPAANPQNADFVETEKWICDGEKIFEYDFENKRLYELTLPPEAQGEGLKNSPLPFVFGAKAAELKSRFWIRDVTPQSVHGKEYWLECWPKSINDAQAYQKVEIILSREPFLPISIHMYSPNYDLKTNPQKMVFQFEQRKINGTLDNMADFMQNFINPRTPFGWDRVPRSLAQQSATPRVGESANGGQNNTPRNRK